MKVAAILFTVVLCASRTDAKTTVTIVPVGHLSVLTQIDDSSDSPIMHVAMLTKKIRMEWRSTDRRIRFFLEDDGAILTDSFDVSKQGTSDKICGRYGGKLRAYQSREEPTKRWLAIRAELSASLTSTCSAVISAQQRAGYTAEFASAASDFAPALEVMKAAAQKEFGGWRRRCVWFQRHGNRPEQSCARYSAKVN